MLAGAARRDTRLAQERRLPSVLIIGAYGGEHIGDAAILGGVLFRIHRRYGTTRAIVLSQRPRHTRHLVPMLDTPVDVTVEGSEPSSARNLLKQVDAVVYAGGPLTDLPKQLVRHFYTVSSARRLGKPFIAEGIGAGPFRDVAVGVDGPADRADGGANSGAHVRRCQGAHRQGSVTRDRAGSRVRLPGNARVTT